MICSKRGPPILKEDFVMFGFRGGASATLVGSASTIKNDRQLAALVKERCSMSQDEADNDGRQGMEGKVI